MTFDRWAHTVDTLCRRHLACSWADLCGDPVPLDTAFAAGETPLGFVRWFAQKFDLEWIDDRTPVAQQRTSAGT